MQIRIHNTAWICTQKAIEYESNPDPKQCFALLKLISGSENSVFSRSAVSPYPAIRHSVPDFFCVGRTGGRGVYFEYFLVDLIL